MLVGNYSEAIRLAELILAKDNCREAIYYRLMESLYKAGQRDRAMKVYQKCIRTLKVELDVKPAPDTVELYNNIKQSKL
jgi:DNA-binding SARP family transcriptional activator